MLNVYCEAFFLHPRKYRQRGLSEHMPYCLVVLIVENDILERVSKAATLRARGLRYLKRQM
jgi:hypothetical protein